MNVEVFAVLLLDKDMPAVRAYKGTNFEVGFILFEPQSTNLTDELATAPGVVIEISMGCAATLAYSISRNRVVAASLYRFEILIVLCFVVSKQEYVIKPFRLLDDRKFVNSKFTVLGTRNVVLGRL